MINPSHLFVPSLLPLIEQQLAGGLRFLSAGTVDEALRSHVSQADSTVVHLKGFNPFGFGANSKRKTPFFDQDCNQIQG